MKTIGLVGGLTWHSSIDYYRIINEQFNKRLGGDEAAKMILFSINYGEIKKLTKEGAWDRITAILIDAAKRTEKAGAECLLIGANTMHHVAESIQAAIQIPLLHIADATGACIEYKGLKKVALLGTKYTMQFDFYRDKLALKGIETIIPNHQDIERVNDTIYNELGKGLILPETKQFYLALIDQLIKQGSEGVILGCTEIPLLIKQNDCSIPVFDTTTIHATAAVNFSLSEYNLM